MTEVESVLRALRVLRAPRTTDEYSLHRLVADALCDAGFSVLHEASLGPRRRIDFLCGSVGVEVKRGRPAAAPLLRQLSGYAASDRVTALVLVAEHPPRLPASIAGKPLATVSLNRLWGVAL